MTDSVLPELLSLYPCSANTLHAAPGDCSPACRQLGALGVEAPTGGRGDLVHTGCAVWAGDRKAGRGAEGPKAITGSSETSLVLVCS